MQEISGLNPTPSDKNSFSLSINPNLTPPTDQPNNQVSMQPNPINTVQENTFPTQPPTSDSEPKKNSSKNIWLGIIIFLLILVFGTITTAVLAAYDKITLPNQTLHEAVSYTVINMPFMPKTPKYVLAKTALAHTNLASAYIKSTLSTESNDLKKLLGLDTLDFKIEGPVDYNDKSNPKTAINLELSNELDVDLKFLNKIIFFKLNKLPEIVHSYLFLTDANMANNPILNQWVSYDFSEIEIKDPTPNKTDPDVVIEETLMKLLKTEIVPNLLMTNDQLDGASVYKIELPLTQQELAEIQKEFSDLSTEVEAEMQNAVSKNDISFIHDFKITLWIDTVQYQLRKSELTATLYKTTYQNTLQVLGASTIADTNLADFVSFTWTVLLSDLGKDFTSEIKVPDNSVEFEMYANTVNDWITKGGSSSMTNEPDFEGFGTTTPKRNPLQ